MWAHWISYVLNVFIQPGLIVATYVLIGRFAQSPQAAQANMIGVAFYSIATITMGGILQTFGYDRSFGTLAIALGTNASRFMVFANRVIRHLPNAVLAMSTSLVVAWLFFDLHTAHVAWAAAVLLVGAAI